MGDEFQRAGTENRYYFKLHFTCRYFLVVFNLVKKTSYDDGYFEILDNDKVGMALVWPHFENFRKKYFSKIILGSHISESLQRSFSKLRLSLNSV